MTENKAPSTKPNIIQKLTVIWLSHMGLVAILYVVLTQALQNSGSHGFDLSDQSRMLALLAVGTMAMGFFIPGLLAKPNPKAPTVNAESQFFVFSILRSTMFESIAIIGFAIAMTEKNPTLFIPFGVAALALLFLFSRPSEDRYKAFKVQFEKRGPTIEG